MKHSYACVAYTSARVAHEPHLFIVVLVGVLHASFLKAVHQFEDIESIFLHPMAVVDEVVQGKPDD